LLLEFATTNGPDGFTATNAIATAADTKVTTPAMRRCDTRRFRVNERRVFICVEMADSKPEERERARESADCQDMKKKIKTFYIKVL